MNTFFKASGGCPPSQALLAQKKEEKKNFYSQNRIFIIRDFGFQSEAYFLTSHLAIEFDKSPLQLFHATSV